MKKYLNYLKPYGFYNIRWLYFVIFGKFPTKNFSYKFFIGFFLSLFLIFGVSSASQLYSVFSNELNVNGTQVVSSQDGYYTLLFSAGASDYYCTVDYGSGSSQFWGWHYYIFDSDVSITCSRNFQFRLSYVPISNLVNQGVCESTYSLIPESSIDTNYCVSNDLCPVSGTGSSSWSELVINDVVHESAPLINITIPQEYSWDYNITENEFTLDISGYNVDYEYIDGIITTQNSKPTTEDFNNIVSGLIPLFVPGLVIILFLWFCFKLIKKIF